ncbi:MAG: DUF1611 domain-containing protein [Thermoanaerobaculia bacterium]
MSAVEGEAIVYCERAFGTTNGKTAHGLVRRSERYRVVAIIDSRHSGKDAGEVLDGKPAGIPILRSLEAALTFAATKGEAPTHFVIGLAPDGGRLPEFARRDVMWAIEQGLNIVSGLHDFLGDDPAMAVAAASHAVTIHDVRKPPPPNELHFFSGKIEAVRCLKVAALGTDSAVGKRTTAWLLKDALEERGWSAELVGTGQTAWIQGARFGTVVDSIVSDFVAGEIEHAVWSAWKEARPDVLLLEGQGSLMNPAYPGGFELLAAGRPDVIVLQHAPARKDYDGFPGYRIHPLRKQIKALELISGKPVVAVTLNHENLSATTLDEAKKKIARDTELVVCDPLQDGCGVVVRVLEPFLGFEKRPLHGRAECVE